jgi:hypothetical protein
MQPSPELRDLTNRIAQAVGDGDVAFLGRHVSRQADVAFLGTDPDEWWTDLSGLCRALAAQQQAGVDVIPGAPLAFEEGNVGSAVDRSVRFRVGNQEAPFRFSVIYRREDGPGRWSTSTVRLGSPTKRRSGSNCRNSSLVVDDQRYGPRGGSLLAWPTPMPIRRMR